MLSWNLIIDWRFMKKIFIGTNMEEIMKQSKVETKYSEKINWFFDSMWLLVADQIPETNCWNENVSTQKSEINFIEKITVHTHFLRIMLIEMRFCGSILLTLAHEFIFYIFYIISRPN